MIPTPPAGTVPGNASGGASADRLLLDLAVSDVRQHVYCPRIPYFRLGARLPHRYVTGAMQEGILEHQRTEALEQRRGLRAYGLSDGERSFDVRLRSERLALGGRLDMLISRSSEAIPVEFKNTRAALGLHHKYQLAAYALLAEEQLARPARRAFVYFIPLKHAQVVEITSAVRAYTKRVLNAIRASVAGEQMPDGTRILERCRVCEFLPYCNDRW
ncbi:MAG: CRISPR-associated protein Cas4 [Chloroflexi bacterium]|nr:CRISPR-associated protein Cas4 [Chloroflexota bacterium]